MATYNQNAMTLPSGDVVNFEDAYGRVEYIRGTWTAASGTWTGVTTDPELYDGKKIILFMPYAGSGNATLNLTLSGGGTTGAKNVYFESTTRFTTHKGQYSHLELIYHKAHVIGSTTYEGWWYLANRDTTVNYQLRNASNLKVTTAVTANSIIVGTQDGYKKAAIGETFSIDYPILWCTQARTANTQNGAENYFVINGRTVTTAYSSFTGGAVGKMVYLVANVIGRSATIVSPFLTTTIPTSEDGYTYFPIGIMSSTTVFDFNSTRAERFAYIDGEFQPVGGAGGSGSTGFGGVEMHGVVLDPDDWSSNSQTVSITTAAVATSDFLSIPQVETAAEYTGSGIVLSTVNVDATNHTASLTFTCTTAPTAQVATTVIVSTSAMETEIDLAEAIANYPKIQNGRWYTYDITNQRWVDSGVKAGITSIVQTTTSTADGGTNVVTATLSDGTTSTFSIKNGAKGSTGAKGDTGDSGNFYFSNKAVAASAWVADTTYEDYPVKATVACTGVTANDGVDLVYGMDDATSGNFAPIANTVSNGVEIWAKEAAAITIPTIIIHPPANGSIATPTATWLDQVYPVGSVYTGSSTTNPGSLFGGSWTLISHVSQSINYASTINIAGSFPANPLSTSTNTYTVPEDGWVYYAVDRGTNSGNTLIFWVDGTDRFHHAAYSAYANADMLVPVVKGQVLKFTTDGTSATWTIRKVEFYKNDYSLYNWRRTA